MKIWSNKLLNSIVWRKGNSLNAVFRQNLCHVGQLIASVIRLWNSDYQLWNVCCLWATWLCNCMFYMRKAWKHWVEFIPTPLCNLLLSLLICLGLGFAWFFIVVLIVFFLIFLLQGLVVKVSSQVRGAFRGEDCLPYLLGDCPRLKICP